MSFFLGTVASGMAIATGRAAASGRAFTSGLCRISFGAFSQKECLPEFFAARKECKASRLRLRRWRAFVPSTELRRPARNIPRDRERAALRVVTGSSTSPVTLVDGELTGNGSLTERCKAFTFTFTSDVTFKRDGSLKERGGITLTEAADVTFEREESLKERGGITLTEAADVTSKRDESLTEAADVTSKRDESLTERSGITLTALTGDDSLMGGGITRDVTFSAFITTCWQSDKGRMVSVERGSKTGKTGRTGCEGNMVPVLGVAKLAWVV